MNIFFASVVFLPSRRELAALGTESRIARNLFISCETTQVTWQGEPLNSHCLLLDPGRAKHLRSARDSKSQPKKKRKENSVVDTH